MSESATIEASPASEAKLFARRWGALHETGKEIGAMAALAPEPLDGTLAMFPSRIEEIGGARLALVRDALADIDAILQPGLAALRTIQARGQDTTAPALALWREFHALRTALIGLAHESEGEPSSVAA